MENKTSASSRSSPVVSLSERRVSWLVLLLPALLFLSAWVWLFWPMMTGQTAVGFRDSAYLYFPMYQWIDSQWATEGIPLWNPYCNFGMPLVGDGTSGVLYPGKLMFACPILSYPARYGIYLASHILLAGLGTYWLARTLAASRPGATLSALSYALGGSVIFQVTNAIYLVSAAWLPFSVLCIWKLIKTGQIRWAIGAGACCALMILGGEPQTVYHVGLIALFSTLGEFLKRRRRERRGRGDAPGTDSDSTAPNRSSAGWLIKGLTAIVIMVAATILLSLVQLLPSYEWSKFSERTQPGLAVNIYSAGQQLLAGAGPKRNDIQDSQGTQKVETKKAATGSDVSIAAALLGPPPPDTITDHAYQFSQSPWSMLELFWPAVSGKFQPVHQRWVEVFPGSGRFWVPSLYMGLLTIWLALGGMRLFGFGRATWLTRIGLFFAIASFGWYGLVWLFNEMAPGDGIKTVGPQVGGFYWLMMMVLPKYFSFRYPAKLFLIASLCLSLLAGLQMRSPRLKFSHRGMLFYTTLTSVLLFLVAFGFHDEKFSNVPADGLFGPFDASGATRGLMFSLVQGLVVFGLAYWWVNVKWTQTRANLSAKNASAVISTSSKAWRGSSVALPPAGGGTTFDPSHPKNGAPGSPWLWAIVVLTLLDLVVANRWMLCEVPAVAFDAATPKLNAAFQQPLERVEPVTIFRRRDTTYLPKSWYESQSKQRLEEVLQWQRESVFPKQQLASQPLVGSKLGSDSGSGMGKSQTQKNIRLLGSFSSIWPTSYNRLLDQLEGQFPLDSNLGPIPFADGHLWLDNLPEDYEIVIDWAHSPPPFCFLVDATENGELAADNFSGGDDVLLPSTSSANSGDCRVTGFRSNRFSVEVDLQRKQWLICNQFFDGNWKAKVLNRRTGDDSLRPVSRISEFYQGIYLVPGSYEVEFTYVPERFWLGAKVSGLSWFVFLVGLAIILFPRFVGKRNDVW